MSWKLQMHPSRNWQLACSIVFTVKILLVTTDRLSVVQEDEDDEENVYHVNKCVGYMCNSTGTTTKTTKVHRCFACSNYIRHKSQVSLLRVLEKRRTCNLEHPCHALPTIKPSSVQAQVVVLVGFFSLSQFCHNIHSHLSGQCQVYKYGQHNRCTLHQIL